MPTAEQSSDVQYLALLRALGFDRDDNERTAARETARVDDAETQAIPEIEYQGTLGRRGVLQQRRSQGLTSSSYTRQLLAERARETQRLVTDVQAGAAISRGDIESDQASRISGYYRTLAESGLETSDRIERRRAERAALGLVDPVAAPAAVIAPTEADVAAALIPVAPPAATTNPTPTYTPPTPTANPTPTYTPYVRPKNKKRPKTVYGAGAI